MGLRLRCLDLVCEEARKDIGEDGRWALGIVEVCEGLWFRRRNTCIRFEEGRLSGDRDRYRDFSLVRLTILVLPPLLSFSRFFSFCPAFSLLVVLFVLTVFRVKAVFFNYRVPCTHESRRRHIARPPERFAAHVPCRAKPCLPQAQGFHQFRSFHNMIPRQIDIKP